MECFTAARSKTDKEEAVGKPRLPLFWLSAVRDLQTACTVSLCTVSLCTITVNSWNTPSIASALTGNGGVVLWMEENIYAGIVGCSF